MTSSQSKLDLNHLLAKYEGGLTDKSFSVKYLTPKNSRVQQPLKQIMRQSNKYGKINDPYVGNFHMSKSQCQQFLYKIKQQLNNQHKDIKYCSDNAMKQIHQNFQKQHQNIKKQILQLLQKAFIQNQKNIKQQILKQRQIQPIQFKHVHQKIRQFQDHIQKLLHQLKGVDYRRAIAQVVLKDYNCQMYQLRQCIKSAKDQYLSNLSGTQIDRSRIQCIKTDLNNMFQLSKKNVTILKQTFLNVIDQKSIVKPSFQMPQCDSPKEPQRGSFFNFMFN